MLKGLSKVIALSGHIEKGSVLDLLFDRDRGELYGYKHSADAKPQETPRGSVYVATLTNPATAGSLVSLLSHTEARAYL